MVVGLVARSSIVCSTWTCTSRVGTLVGRTDTLRVLVTECSFVPLHTSACSHRRVGTLVSRTDTLRVLVTECSFVPLHTSACSHPRVGTLVSRTDTLRVVCTSVPLQPADMLVLTRS